MNPWTKSSKQDKFIIIKNNLDIIVKEEVNTNDLKDDEYLIHAERIYLTTNGYPYYRYIAFNNKRRLNSFILNGYNVSFKTPEKYQDLLSGYIWDHSYSSFSLEIKYSHVNYSVEISKANIEPNIIYFCKLPWGGLNILSLISFIKEINNYKSLDHFLIISSSKWLIEKIDQQYLNVKELYVEYIEEKINSTLNLLDEEEIRIINHLRFKISEKHPISKLKKIGSTKSEIKSIEETQKQAGTTNEIRALNDLEKMIGLTNVKDEIKQYLSLMEFDKKRIGEGKKTKDTSLHFVFSGSPGTGKTTVARLIGEIFKSLGLLTRGHLIETTRTELVGQYVGHTEKNFEKKIDEAKGGVLFIDEAYALTNAESSIDYGKRIVDALCDKMENLRDDLCVIVAGYKEEMEKFINSNPGLESRFTNHLHFEDYSNDELLTIFKDYCDDFDFVLTDDAEKALFELFDIRKKEQMKSFGNAREVRNIFEKTYKNFAVRSSRTKEDTNEILVEDLPKYLTSKKEKIKDKIDAQRLPQKSTIEINDGDIGYSYENLFTPYFKNAKKIEINEPYVKEFYQFENFKALLDLICELSISNVILNTKTPSELDKIQKDDFDKLIEGLKKRNTMLNVDYDETIHDRCIKIDNSWVITLGRGLDFFHRPDRYDLSDVKQTRRECKKTRIDFLKVE